MKSVRMMVYFVGLIKHYFSWREPAFIEHHGDRHRSEKSRMIPRIDLVSKHQSLHKIIERISIGHTRDKHTIWSKVPLHTFEKRTVICEMLKQFARHNHIVPLFTEVHIFDVRNANIVALLLQVLDRLTIAIHTPEAPGPFLDQPVQPPIPLFLNF